MSLLVKKNLVSTIIPVFNRPMLVVDAVNSVLEQHHRPIEILVVDDGSTDETPQVLLDLAKQHPEINVLTQTNQGPGAARELGRLNVRGEFVQYLDSDDLLLPSKFQQQVQALSSTPEADVAYGKTETIKFNEAPRQTADGQTGVQHSSMFPQVLRERWWSTSTPLFRRSVVEAAGPWSELWNEEDWEYDCRVASLGGRLVFVDAFVSLTRSHDDHLCDGGGVDPQKLRHRVMARAKILQHAKTYMTLSTRPSDIEVDDWVFFSKYAFLLARQCALAGLTIEARAMTSISIEAVGKKTVQHVVFLKLVKLLGWQRAAKAIALTGR